MLCNIMAFQKYEKADFEKFRELIIKRASKFFRMRSYATKLLGRYMFKDMGAEALAENADMFFVKKSGIHNEEQIAEFMAREQCIRERMGGYQWRVYFFEDYNEHESVAIFKVHHSLMDGMALILMFMNLCDEPDINDIPPISVKFTLFQQLLQVLIIPFYVNFLNVKLLCFMDT